MSCKSVFQARQFLPKDRQRKKPFNIRLSDLPDRRWKEAVNPEFIELADRVDDFMHGPPLFRCDLGATSSLSFKERSDWEPTPQVGDPVGISQEDVGPQTPIVGVQRGVDRDTANDDGPERHEFENMIEHSQASLRGDIGITPRN